MKLRMGQASLARLSAGDSGGPLRLFRHLTLMKPLKSLNICNSGNWVGYALMNWRLLLGPKLGGITRIRTVYGRI